MYDPQMLDDKNDGQLGVKTRKKNDVYADEQKHVNVRESASVKR